MVARLWDKGGSADAAMMRYTARDDWQLDEALLVYDLRASSAHVRGLVRIEAIDPKEGDAILEVLSELERAAIRGEFPLSPEVEDGHTAIEAKLIERLGDPGKRVHLGRSRNDQVLVALRLFERDALDELAALACDAATSFVELARAEERTVLPGYTHLQRAVPHTVGHWAASFAEGFSESARALIDARAQVDASPLGGAAGYGVNLPLDRDGVANDLGFEDLVINPLWSQSSRGLTEVLVLAAAWHAQAVARRLAWDLSLFVTAEFGFMSLPEDLTTGSSIMPNKRNPDVVELMRASAAIVQGAMNELMTMVALPSGYHRDLQLTKAPIIRSLRETRDTLALVPRIVSGLRLDRERMRDAVTVDTLATDRAVDLARQGLPFREAYRRVAADLGSATEPAGDRAAASIEARSSTGSPGALSLDRLAQRLEGLRNKVRAVR